MYYHRDRRYVDILPVEVLIPKRWWHPPLYRLLGDMEIVGLVVPKGFVSDGATVPRFLWWCFPPVCRYLRAALVHDYLLEQGAGWRKANDRFRAVLKYTDVPKWRRGVMVLAVEFYGLVRWDHRKGGVSDDMDQ